MVLAAWRVLLSGAVPTGLPPASARDLPLLPLLCTLLGVALYTGLTKVYDCSSSSRRALT